MESERSRWLFLLVGDWTLWAWAITAVLLAVGLLGYEEGFVGAFLLSAAQFVVMLARDRSLAAFPVQLRLAYTLLLILCFPQPMRWLYWLPTVGTFALVLFGYSSKHLRFAVQPARPARLGRTWGGNLRGAFAVKTAHREGVFAGLKGPVVAPHHPGGFR